MNWPVDVTDYLLGELSDESRALGDALMADDPRFRAEVERLRPLVMRLETLPPEAWEGIAPPPAPVLPRPWASRLRSIGTGRLVVRPALAVAASLVLIAGGVGIGLLAGGGSGDDAPEGARYALSPLDGATAGAQAVATVAGGTLRVELSGIAPTPAGSFYELWLLNSPTDLVSIASFKVPSSGTTTVTVPLPDDPDGYRFLDLSVEPADGNPAHSGASVLRGETA
jgi:anti-sigma-K factor RskA